MVPCHDDRISDTVAYQPRGGKLRVSSAHQSYGGIAMLVDNIQYRALTIRQEWPEVDPPVANSRA